MRITLTTPTDVITAAAWILGFYPTDSLTVLAYGGTAPTSRVDFPHTGEALIEAAAALGAAYRRNPGGQAVILAHASDPVAAIDAITAVTAMLDGLVDVTQGLIVNGDRWLSTGGGAGTIDPARVNLIAAEMVVMGMTPPKSNRAGIAADLDPIDAEPIETARAAVTADSRTPEWVRARIAEFHDNGLHPSDRDAAAVLLALTDDAVFDAVLIDHTNDNARGYVTLWHDLTRRGPHDLRGNAAALLALSAWLAGDGALAWEAIDQSNDRALVQIVGELLTAAINPNTWEEIRTSITGDAE